MTHPITPYNEQIDVSTFDEGKLSFYYMHALPAGGSGSIMHLYQCLKTRREGWIRLITDSATGELAEQVGNMAPLSVRLDDETKKAFMLSAIEFFVKNVMDFRLRLASTDSLPIIYGRADHEWFWGKCYCNECMGKGLNMYGICLVESRDKLILS